MTVKTGKSQTSGGRLKFSVAFPPEIVQALDRIAKEEYTDRTAIVLQACRDYIQRRPKLAQLREMVG